MRLYSPTGPRLGTAAVTGGSGDVYRYSPTSTPITAVTGKHDVYLMLSKDVRIASVTLGSPRASGAADWGVRRRATSGRQGS